MIKIGDKVVLESVTKSAVERVQHWYREQTKLTVRNIEFRKKNEHGQPYICVEEPGNKDYMFLSSSKWRKVNNLDEAEEIL